MEMPYLETVTDLSPDNLVRYDAIIDVRSPAEFAGGSAPGSINIPLSELGSRLAEIPKTAPVVLCCASGSRSGMAKMMLKKNGYQQVFNVGKWRNLIG